MTVARTSDQFRAAMWQSVLESAGIDAELHGTAMGGVYAGIGQVAAVSVVVREEDLDDARALLAAAETAAAGHGAADGEEPAREDGGDATAADGES